MNEVEVTATSVSIWDDVAMLRIFSNPQPVVLVRYPDHTSQGFLMSLTLQTPDA